MSRIVFGSTHRFHVVSGNVFLKDEKKNYLNYTNTAKISKIVPKLPELSDLKVQLLF